MSWLYTIVFAGLMFSSNDSQLFTKSPANASPFVSTVAAAPLPEETEKFEQSYPLNAGGRVSVSNVNGSVVIEAWDKNEVKLEYVKTADSKENLELVKVQIDARPDAFSVETDYGDWSRRGSGNWKSSNKMQVEYRLTVPRGAILREIETVNGSININGTTNLTKASSVNGEVRATNLRGTANLSTVNGTVIADFDQLQSSGRISLETVNGTVELLIPSDANATIKADTVNGKISNDFGLPVRKGEYVGNDLHGRLGSGTLQIRLTGVNGALSVKRKNDGKTPLPVVNLLNMKSDDNDENWDTDDEDNSEIRAPRAPRAPKAPQAPPAPTTPLPPLPPVTGEFNSAEMRRTVEDALRQAQREIEKMGPEVESKYAEALRMAEKMNSDEMRAQSKALEALYNGAMARYSEGYFSAFAPAVEKKSGSFAVKGTPKVSVEGRNCEVTVRGWDKPEVSYSVVRISRSNGKNSNTQWTTDAVKKSDSSVSIKVSEDAPTRGEWSFDNSMRTRIEVFVPKKSDLKIITDGEIRLEGVSGDIDLKGSEGAINVRDSDGKLNVSSSDGRIRVVGFRGAFEGTTDDGAMSLEGDFDKLSAQTIDGTIVLTLPENANATIESNRKDITAEGLSLNLQGDGQKNSRWKIGSGGNNYFLNTTADGKIIVRAANALKSN